MRLSHRVRYAICGVFDLAYNGRGAPVQIRVIGERQAIPTRYLEQIFNRLRRAGIVAAKRGPGGGYTLAALPDAISLLSVIEAVEGPIAQALEPESAAPPPGTHRPDFLWSHLAGRLSGALDGITLETLCRQAAASHVERAPEVPMYHI